MTKPKYKIVQDNHGERTLWFVKLVRNGEILSHHVDQASAEKAAQRYVSEDRMDF